MPKNADWIKQKAVAFDPDNNKVTIADGEEISYEFLVIAMGLQLNYHLVSFNYYLNNGCDIYTI